ncbi:MAG: phosphoglucosamine mutase, partial [Chloroflexota bacterium]|nr:phosphoglucosamine mutase [Chloroflexota bacterium]
PWEHMESSRPYPGALETHLDRILRDFGRAPFKVVVDGGGGAASLATPRLLKELGGEVITLNCQPTGTFPRGSEPLPENLNELMALVTSTGAHLGIAHDGDGDRTVAVDDKGRFIPGDKLLILLARGLGVSRLVTTVDATMALEETGLEVVRTKVGDAHVSEALKKKGGDLGGEPAGAWIFPRISYCPDGLYAAAQLAFMASAERLSALVDSIPSYPLLRGSVEGNAAWAPLEERLMDLKPLSTNGEDGVKLLFADGWLLVRPSGTEPKIRVSAEARDAKEAERLFRRGMEIVRASVKEEQGALR